MIDTKKLAEALQGMTYTEWSRLAQSIEQFYHAQEAGLKNKLQPPSFDTIDRMVNR